MSGAVADPRAVALAEYLRERAAAFSLSADATGGQHIAVAGMALLDAASLAETLTAEDQRLLALADAGCFETMPNGQALFLETARLKAAVQRPLSGPVMSGSDILAALVRAVLDR